MKISLNYLKRYLDFELPPVNELADVIGRRLGALEGSPVNLAEVYKDVLIVKVEDCQKIADSDHLNLCLINDNQMLKDVQRNADGLISVVCGAPNVKKGLMAAWLPPGSVLPASFNKDQLVIEARPILGVLSGGMLASPSELAMSDDHSGILVVESDAKPGDSFMDTYEFNDYIIDVENKMFTHRPDCFGLIGIAREVSGILSHAFKSPQWYLMPEEINVEGNIDLKVQNELSDKVSRFSIIGIDGIEIKPSPSVVQSYLSRLGVRPINNVVDLTNIVMLETGQPLHAYDLNKLKAMAGDQLTLSVRSARPNEKIKLLNGKEVTPPQGSICIAVNDRLVGIGGVMGGQNSEVDEKTTAIVLEAASFDMYSIRKTSMELGLFSDAVTRFTKGQSPLQTVRVLSYALNKLKELSSGAKASSSVVDDVHLPETTLKRGSLYPAIAVSVDFINDRLGSQLSPQQMADLLTNVECQVAIDDKTLIVSPPFWRTDIEIREDVVEEVGRLYGYENIVASPLIRTVLPTPKNKELDSCSTLRKLLASAGANELLTYSFVSKKLVENANQSVDQAYEIANSLSPELEFYRLSLTPSLLSKVHLNIKAGFNEFAVFEIGTYHLAGRMNPSDTALPAEYPSLALVYGAKQPKHQAAYFQAKAYLQFLLNELNIKDVSFIPLNKVTTLDDSLSELAKPFDKVRSALIRSADKQWGIVGEYLPSVTSSLKLPKYAAGFEVDSQLFLLDNSKGIYKQLSKYPSVKQDITLKIETDSAFAELNDFLIRGLTKLAPKGSYFNFLPKSIFKPAGQKAVNYSFHLEIAREDRTLKDQEVNDILDELAKEAKDKFKATRI